MVNNSSTGTRGVLSTLLASFIFLSLIVPAAMGQANVKGQWTTLSLTTPINPVHAALMKNGKVLIVAGSGNCPPSQSGCPTGPPYGPGNASGAEVFDPVAGTITQFTVPYDMFCNGMIVLPDGRPFINSGTIQYDPFFGALQSGVFDSSTNTFTTVQNMAHGRWYPTLTTLGDGRVMTFSGTDEHGNTNTTVEIYTVGTGWSQQYPSGWTPPLYPRMTLLPSGKVFYSGSGTSSALFDPSNTSWTLNVANTIFSGQRGYGTTVLLPLTPANGYDPRVMIMGGDSPATATTEIIDMGAASPKWTSGPNMSQARSQMNAVILPNGKVLAMGGSVNDEDLGSLSLNADLYDPVAKTFSSAGANVYERLYHSVALLLPDATVWLTGGNPSRGTYEPHMEIYQPAYLFNSSGGLATRPTITSAPSSVSWGNAFAVQTPDAANISSVVLVRPGAVTHSFNMDQRLVGMSFTAGSGTLTVTAPPNGNIAPPGYYMLFLLNSSGVPSQAAFIQLVAGGGNPAPTVSGVVPASGTTAGGTAVQISGTGFLAGATVRFGGTAASNVVVASSTSITATTPAHAAGGVNVVVTNTDGQSGTSTNGYTYTGGTLGTIAFVQVNSATPANNSSPVSVTYPLAQTAGNLNVVVVGWNDTTSSVSSVVDTRGNSYTLAVGPTSGTGLRQSIYYAKNIVGGSNTVTVTFNQAAFYVDVRALEYSGLDTATPLDVTAGAVGTGLSANSGSATTTSSSELIFGAGTTGGSFGTPPSGFVRRILTPDSDIAIDKTVSSTGSNSASSTLTYSSTWVMQMAAFRASGQGGTTNPAPTVSGVLPASGTTAGGTGVTVSGTGFLAGATVAFGGTAATNVVVVSSTSITATTPAHAAGAVNVVVTNTDGQSGPLSNGYTYTTANPAPTVSGVLPASGTTAGGTGVTVSGTGFLAGATVTFGGTAATNVVVVSGTSITATTPAHAAGAVNVVVTNTDGQSGPLSNGYTYTTANPAPTVSGVVPASGTTAGGTAVQISGTGFLAGATVTFGGTAASNVVVVSSTSITATTPAHAAGGVNVVVTNTDGQSGTSTNGYTYSSSSGGGTIAFVQVNSATPANNSSPVSVTYPLAQAAGNLNIVVVGWNDTTSTVSSVVDTRGNSYTLAVGPTSGTALRQSIYYAKNIVGGSNTVTVTFNQAAFYVDVRVLEYSGLDTTAPLDVTAGAVGTGWSANSGSATTTSANELIFGAGTTGGTFGTVGTGFVRRILTPDSDIAIDKTVSSTGSNSTSSALAYSSTWVMQMATFKAKQ